MDDRSDTELARALGVDPEPRPVWPWVLLIVGVLAMGALVVVAIF